MTGRTASLLNPMVSQFIPLPSSDTMQEDSPAAVVITDLTLSFRSTFDEDAPNTLDRQKWHRVEKELYLHTLPQSAWLYIAHTREDRLSPNDDVVTDVKVSEAEPNDASDGSWESRPGGIWLQRRSYARSRHRGLTGIDVLFGVDAVDPRPGWTLLQTPLKLRGSQDVAVARLSLRAGAVRKIPQAKLRINENGKFKIMQVSDTHMVTGVGVCKDAIDGHGRPLPDSEADPLTVDFLRKVLDDEKPDLVILTGDQVHHDIPDTQTALFKVVAPLIERAIPYAAVFGNHDSEGKHALSRK